MDNMLVTSTLLLGFLVGVFLQNMNYDSLLATDERYIRAERAVNPEYNQLATDYYFISGMAGIVLLTCAIWLTMLIKLSFYLSVSPSEPSKVQRWGSYGVYVINFNILLFCCGVVFYQHLVHGWVILNFPLYPISMIKDHSIYDNTVDSRWSGHQGSLVYEPPPFEDQLFVQESYKYKMATNITCIGIFLAIVIFHIWHSMGFEEDEEREQLEREQMELRTKKKIKIFLEFFHKGMISQWELSRIVFQIQKMEVEKYEITIGSRSVEQQSSQDSTE